MSEPISHDADTLKYMKLAYDRHATVVHLFKTRFQFYYEEFEGIQDIVAFYSELGNQLLKKIHEIEPPAPKEPQKPFVVEVPQPTVESSGHEPA